MKQSEPYVINMDRLRSSAERARELDSQRDLEKAGNAPMALVDTAFPFVDLDLDLNDAAFTAAVQQGKTVSLPGHKLRFLREGSTPGARLTVVNGAEVQHIGPGDVIDAPFKGLTLFRSRRSTLFGRARLKLITRAGVDFDEPEVRDVATEGAKLVGDVSLGTFVTVAENTQPTQADPSAQAGAFDCVGWRKLRIWIDGGATLESLELYPWVAVEITAAANGDDFVWFEQGQAGPIAVPLPASAAAYQYRVVVVDLIRHVALPGNALRGRDRREWMFFEVRALLPGALTGVGIAIEGLE